MKRLQYSKKGNINNAVNSIIMLITGVGVAVLVFIFVGTLGGQSYQMVESKIDALTGNSYDTQFTALNSTAVFVHKNVVSGTLSLENATGKVHGLNNFDINYATGMFTLKNNTINNTVVNATFQYGNPEMQSAIKNSIVSGFNGLEQTGSYLPMIVLAVTIALVLALVLGMGGGSSGGNSTAL